MALLLVLGAVPALGAEPPAAEPVAAEVDEARAESQTASGAADAAAGEAAPGQAGLRVYIDPETGLLTSHPTEAQRRALDEELGDLRSVTGPLSRSDVGLVPFRLRGGGVGVHLEGRFQSATVVRVLPDGSLATSCIDHPEHAHEALAHTAEDPDEPAVEPGFEGAVDR